MTARGERNVAFMPSSPSALSILLGEYQRAQALQFTQKLAASVQDYLKHFEDSNYPTCHLHQLPSPSSATSHDDGRYEPAAGLADSRQSFPHAWTQLQSTSPSWPNHEHVVDVLGVQEHHEPPHRA